MSEAYNFKVNEQTESLDLKSVDNSFIFGAILNANGGYGNVPLVISSTNELLAIDLPNEYNYQHHKIIEDVVSKGHTVKVLRPIHTTAKNGMISFANSGNNLVKTNSNNSNAFYNTKVADVSLQNMTSADKLSFMNRFVTTKQDTVIAVCSDVTQYDLPMFDQTLKAIDLATDLLEEPANPISGQSNIVDGDFLTYNGSTWDTIVLTNGMQVYDLSKGYVVKYVLGSTSWIKSFDQDYKIQYDSITGVVISVVKYNLTDDFYDVYGNIKTFRQMYGEYITFSDNEIVVMVLKKNSDDKWYNAKVHEGNYVEFHKDTEGNYDYIMDVINDNSLYIYCKVTSNDYLVETITPASRTIILSENEDASSMVVNGSITLNDVTLSGVSVSDLMLTIASVEKVGSITTLTVNEDITDISVSASSYITDIAASKISTNKSNIEVEDLLIYDTAPLDGSGVAITNYSIVTQSDMNTAADNFKDVDKIYVNSLLPMETTAPSGVKDVNKMSEVAEARTMTSVVLCPFDGSIFAGKTDSEITSALVTYGGSKRTSGFGGVFSRFNKYTSFFGIMKNEFDPYAKKMRWYSCAGDIAAKEASKKKSTIIGDGLHIPIAGVGNGEISSNITFFPEAKYRKILGDNNINFVVKNDLFTTPTIMSNDTSDVTKSIFQKTNVRLTLNDIESYILLNCIQFYFKLKNDTTIDNLIENTQPILDFYNGAGAFKIDPTLTIDIDQGSDDELIIDVILQFVGVIKNIKLNIIAYSSEAVIITES